MVCNRILCWFKSTSNSHGRVSHHSLTPPLKKSLSLPCKMERCMLIFQAVAKFSRCWAQKMRVMLPRASSFQSAQRYQGNTEELRAVRSMTSHLLISLHKVSVKIFGKILLAITLPDLVNEGKHVLQNYGGEPTKCRSNWTHNSKLAASGAWQEGHESRPYPQPSISGAIFMFPVSCSADERMQRDAPLEPGHTKIS